MTLIILLSCRRDLRIALALSLLLLSGCATAPGNPDPYEATNRRVFAFNEQVDRTLLSPLARGYRAVVPAPIRRGVSNFFANLGDFGGTVNAGLQGNGAGAAKNGSRFLLNSTLGLAGVFDVANRLGIGRYETDFGHTLAVWGAPQGAYLVLPLLGPATSRSGIGRGVDFALQQQLPMHHGTTVRTMGLIDTRSSLVAAEGLLSGDHYLFIRDAYLQRRASLLGESPTATPFADETELDWGD